MSHDPVPHICAHMPLVDVRHFGFRGQVKRIFDTSNNTRQAKPVYQYTCSGKYLGSYASTAEAALAVGTSDTNIAKVARGVHKTAARFCWSYVKR